MKSKLFMHMHIGREKKKAGSIYIEIMAETFPKSMKKLNTELSMTNQ